MRIPLFIALLLLGIGRQTARAQAPVTHKPFDEVLRRHVNPDGDVNYKSLRLDHSMLDAYLVSLRENAPNETWTREDSLVYWINAYNGFTIDLILDNYPLASIKDLDGGEPWDVKRIQLGDSTYSLNQIENEIIRPQFKDPRIHFAVNCAAASCPPIRQESYYAKRVDTQLEQQAKKFINDETYNRLDGDTFTVSKVFDWYGGDFGDLAAYLGKYRELPAGVDLEFGEYDWSLNKQE